MNLLCRIYGASHLFLNLSINITLLSELKRGRKIFFDDPLIKGENGGEGEGHLRQQKTAYYNSPYTKWIPAFAGMKNEISYKI